MKATVPAVYWSCMRRVQTRIHPTSDGWQSAQCRRSYFSIVLDITDWWHHRWRPGMHRKSRRGVGLTCRILTFTSWAMCHAIGPGLVAWASLSL